MNINRGVKEFLFALMAICVVPSVSAAYYGTSFLSDSVRQGIEVFNSFFGPFFEAIIGDYSGSQFFFVKILLGILLFVVVRVVLLTVPLIEDQKGVCTIIAMVVAIFGIRYISENQLTLGILLPYGALGVAITTIIPFVIYFFFVHKSGWTHSGRRLAWTFFGAVFAILWFTRRNDIGGVGNAIYLGMVIAVIICYIFDNNIKSYFNAAEAEKMDSALKMNRMSALHEQLKKLHAMQDEMGKKAPKDLKNHIHDLEKQLKDLMKQ